jgi:hypothetical protein
MPALIVRWDHLGEGAIKSREYPIDTSLKVTHQAGYSTLKRYDQGKWIQELTTPGELFIQAKVI